MKCPICNSLGNPYHVVNEYPSKKCIHCNHIFVENDQDKQTDLYEEGFYENYMSGMGYDLAYSTILKQDFLKKISLLTKYLPSGASILEIGAGPGYFAQLAENYGYSVTAVETNTGAIQYAQKKGIFFQNFVCENLAENNSSIEGKQFDAVISWAVIEHTEDPISFLRLLKRFVKQDGYIFFDTGVISPLLLFMDPGYTSWLYPPLHLHVFSKKSLLTAIQMAKLDLVKYIPRFNLPINRWKRYVYFCKLSAKVVIHHLKNHFTKNQPGKIAQIGLMICKPSR